MAPPDFNSAIPTRNIRQIQPDCVASTAVNASFFKGAQWTPDGTSVVTNSDDNQLRTYVLPPNLLSSSSPHSITPYYTCQAPSPVIAYALYPYYNLSDTATTSVLYSTSGFPIRLVNTLHPSLHASYKLIDGPTESYKISHSLKFTNDGRRFIAGSDTAISVFDLTRDGEGPITNHKTIPSKRKKIVDGGVGIKGIISALDVRYDGLLAAGTFTRCVGIYADEGQGEALALFSIKGEERCDGVDIGGSGITQCLWSPCGTYLYIVERQSNGAIIYDVRNTGTKLGVLTGRQARTTQRLGVEIIPGHAGEADSGGAHEIWAGGVDGVVGIWKNPYRMEGPIQPQEEFAAHADLVSSTVMHPFANVLATCSGQRQVSYQNTVLTPVANNGSASVSSSVSDVLSTSNMDTVTDTTDECNNHFNNAPNAIPDRLSVVDSDSSSDSDATSDYSHDQDFQYTETANRNTSQTRYPEVQSTSNFHPPNSSVPDFTLKVWSLSSYNPNEEA